MASDAFYILRRPQTTALSRISSAVSTLGIESLHILRLLSFGTLFYGLLLLDFLAIAVPNLFNSLIFYISYLLGSPKPYSLADIH
jgi:hypothetical protein